MGVFHVGIKFLYYSKISQSISKVVNKHFCNDYQVAAQGAAALLSFVGWLNPPKPSLKIGSVNKAFLLWHLQWPKNFF